MTSIEQNAKHHEAESAVAQDTAGDKAETPKAAAPAAVSLDSFGKYVQQVLRTKSPGFMRPVLNADGTAKLVGEGEAAKPEMECYASGPTTDFLHGATGGLTEIGGEFCDALKAHLFYGKPLDRVNLGEELGDSWWYIAIIAAAAQINPDTIQAIIDEAVASTVEHEVSQQVPAIELLGQANYIASLWNDLNAVAIHDFLIDPAAQTYLHGHPEAERAFLALIGQTVALGTLLGHDVRLVWQSNIAKLAKRYPNKFDSNAAQFRRLDEERKLLEANHDANTSVEMGHVEAEPLSRVNLKTFLEAQDGKFVGIDYIKKDGSDRSLNGRLGVTKFLKGGDNTVEALDRSYMTIWDAKASGYRTVDLETASHVRANGRKFVITD